MTRTSTATALALALTVGLAQSAPAQVAWDAPTLLAPGAPAGFGVHLFDPDPGGDLGVLVTWRSNPVPVGLGFRVGIADGFRDGVAVLGGVDVSGGLYGATEETPVDVIWFAGAGAGLDDDILLSFPAGVSVGATLRGDGATFRPYLAPRVILDAWLGDDDRPGRWRRDDDLELGAAVELGVDLAFSSDWAVRATASLGDREAVSIGLHFGR